MNKLLRFQNTNQKRAFYKVIQKTEQDLILRKAGAVWVSGDSESHRSLIMFDMRTAWLGLIGHASPSA